VRRYDATLNDDEPFFFNIKEDAQGEVLIQSGERLKHVRIYITSKFGDKYRIERSKFHTLLKKVDLH